MRAVVYSLIVAVHTFACVPDLDYLPPAIMQRDAPKATGNEPLPVDSSKVYGLKTGTKQRSFYQSSTLVRRQENTSSGQKQHEVTDVIFSNCCRRAGLKDECLGFCTYEGYNTRLVLLMLLERSGCPTTALPMLQMCVSREQEHRRCCVEAGVPVQCLAYCSNAMMSRLTFNGSAAACLEQLEEMKSMLSAKGV
ncbi:hypothetical protein Q1695_014528 [Nippostrongylus brasiliensis]|nr:hypothetical protein Q1695_014528 [Nippostrongylus brasiliensis]